MEATILVSFSRSVWGSRFTWHVDELVVRINDQRSWQWRAVDQDGYVLDEIVQRPETVKQPDAC
ncbi:transposase-like protein [Mesorhizobium soli]|nr:transposase-like protein [Mesorhizobium soli]